MSRIQRAVDGAHLQSMRIDKLGEGVYVVDLLLAQSHAVAPVEAADVGLDGLHHRRPVVFHCVSDQCRRCQTSPPNVRGSNRIP